jgi:hypothetical protein
MTVAADPWIVFAFIIALFGGGRLLLLALLPFVILYGLFRFLKWVIG